ncbi:TonB-dependent siderophore receptor [Gilvimarinus xylanilyticus]|uniref:TonB-dependent siderophore receptor n=1 Tax=Gilvimarinus xylanilyticus TaxID=2944139 RepID=A0A9X2HX06_9GAMM|nr:TonB-dependent siderophore receptor [Gilvimarinus xylanilyticus]MCP8898126.1 TonB-dependent siderophore receptor [Gilvimarinus xylanilyticus]
MSESLRTRQWLLAALIAGFSSQGALAQEGASKQIEDVLVYGEAGETDSATKLNMTIYETPQTVTAISRTQMDDFSLDSVNEVLDYTPGVTVEEVETSRTYYTARGFDIVNFQYDGVGTPFVYGNVSGQLDTAFYDKVEVVKGAAGLVTGLANPSATVNFVRKRPTQQLQASARASVNEWQGYRLDGDVSGSLSDSVRGRLVVATEDTESYLDRYEESTDLFYGVLEADLTDTTLLTLGHSYDDNRGEGILWGALPLVYADGTPTDYDVSTNTAPDWTYRDMQQSQSFVELKQQLSDSWTVNAIYTKTSTDNESELFYVFGTPQQDETGLGASTGRYLNEVDQDMVDLSASGDVHLFGRDHQLVFGYNYADVNYTANSYNDLSAVGSPVLGSDWAEGNSPRPNFNAHDPVYGVSDVEQEHESFYAAARINVTDALSALVGARQAEIVQRGINYGNAANTDADDTVPYYGLTYQITNSLMAYGSYSEVFSQQLFVNDQFEPLGATQGESTEFGLKASFNNDLAVVTLAAFESDLSNLGEFTGRDPETNTAFYAPRQYTSDGYELEFSGELVKGLNVSAGYTWINIDGEAGEAKPYIPEQMLKVSASYRVAAIPALKVGGSLKWQDDINTVGGAVTQESYTLVDLVLQYELTQQLTAAINLKNITDEKYLNSLYWDQAYYGAPRNVSASISWKY